MVSPGLGASAASTSSARTGTGSASVCKTLGNILGAPFGLCELLAPGGAIPDLEVGVDTGDGQLASGFRLLEETRRNHDPPLTVGLDALASGEEEALHHAGLGTERVERPDALGEELEA